MERRYQVRLKELLKDAMVRPEQLQGMLARLEQFVEPFAACLVRKKQRKLAEQYVAGLVSQLEHKNVESIAYHHDQDRQALQKFIGQYTWDHRPLVSQLVKQVAWTIGRENSVLVLDPSAFPKQGHESVGVQRQWCGRFGEVTNCQVGVYLAYASAEEQALVDVRLYLPKTWARSKPARRRCGVPVEVKFQTRQELALAMLDEHGPALPHRWVAGDEEFGHNAEFRGQLHARRERYLLTVATNTVIRDLQARQPPQHPGRGAPAKAPWIHADRWRAELPDTAWMKVEVAGGERGPRTLGVAIRSVKARALGALGHREILVVVREQQTQGTFLYSYHLSNASADTSPIELVRVIQSRHRIEECFQRAKSEAGLADYEVRTWRGWHHHQTLSLIATWFLTQETLQGKKNHPGTQRTSGANDVGMVAA
jgi:SRSO17 transposase